MASASIVSALTRRLEGKVALITGGASGIGECTAKLFSKHGAKVAVADIQDELGHSVVRSIGPNNATFIHCDVTKEEHVQNAVDKAVSTYGKLDIMFNNAGITGPPLLRITDYDIKDFERVWRVNAAGVFLGMKHAARVMVPKRSGTIISSSSLASRVDAGAPHAYVASKHAIVGLTRSMAVELGQFGIRVNCVSPYMVSTPLATTYSGFDEEELDRFSNSMANLKGTTLKADDVADAALFLASDEAKYVSGQNLFIDGGVGITNAGVKLLKYPESS